MKYLKYLFFFSLTLAVVSCSDDANDNPELRTESLVGTWSMISLEAETTSAGEVLTIPFNSVAQTVGSNFDLTVVFTESDYTAVGSYDVSITGTLNGLPIDPVEETVSLEQESGTYSIVNNEIIFEDIFLIVDDLPEDGPDLSVDIDSSIDASGNLVVVQAIEATVMEEGNPIPFTTTINATSIFTRVE